MRAKAGRDGRETGRGGVSAPLAALWLILAVPNTAFAATPAATVIPNTAHATYTLKGAPGSVDSAPVQTFVAEMLDVSVAAQAAEVPA